VREQKPDDIRYFGRVNHPAHRGLGIQRIRIPIAAINRGLESFGDGIPRETAFTRT
jgi:hypothetical protein